ncbi:alanine racemase, partial [Acidobacteriota bacterium]
MTFDDTSKLNTWVELDRQAFFHNLDFFRSILSPGTELIAVVKANAYGHGILPISAMAVEHGVESLAVHSLEEAHLLRQNGIDCSVILLGPCPPRRHDEIIRLHLDPVVSNSETLKDLSEACQKANSPCNIHIKLETGTHRQGVDSRGLDR